MSAEALFNGISSPTNLTNLRWTSPITSRLLGEVTFAYSRQDLYMGAFEENQGRAPFRDIGTGLDYNTSFINIADETHRRHVQASLSYVTGSHNFKAGLTYMNNRQYYSWPAAGDIFLANTFLNFPAGVLVMANGAFQNARQQNCDCGLYAQDAWTIDRLTLNLGLRYDWFNNSIPGGSRPAGFFTPELQIDGYPDIPDWQDWNVRLGAAYDLFGGGGTAVKFSVGRYVANEALGDHGPVQSPLADRQHRLAAVDRHQRGRDDARPGRHPAVRRDRCVVQPQLRDTDQRQLSRSGRAARPQLGVLRRHRAPVGGRWSVSGMWHRRQYSDFRWVDNLNIGTSDRRPLTFTAPSDARLPNGGGEEITIYEWNPGFAFSTGSLLTTLAPDDWRTWNGFEVIVDGTLPQDGFMNASWTAGATENHFCTSAQHDPNRLRFCHNSTPYRHMGKLSGAGPLPFETMISGLFQCVCAIREQLTAHRANPVCASCHRVIDPPGFALESFDPIGGFRKSYRASGGELTFGDFTVPAPFVEGLPVDPSGVTPAGEAFAGIADYKRLMLRDGLEQVARHLASQLLVFSTGAEIEFADRDAVEEIVARLGDDAYPMRKMVHEVVQSDLFRQR